MPAGSSQKLSTPRYTSTLYPTITLDIVAHRAIQGLSFDMAVMPCDNIGMVEIYLSVISKLKCI